MFLAIFSWVLTQKLFITRLLKLMQSPDYIEELRAKLELIKGFRLKTGMH